ncbi:MAG TPA: cytochrome b/b6 domain-containing protein [Acidimicrobiia bacterium]|nr:cytochrome b/b6 domain-containing protein [Acidimicrobiia bacterium]
MDRFDRTERWLHWANATLVGVLVATGAVLYWGELSSIIGRRALFKEIHVIAGLFLPVPFLLALPGRRGRRLRRDLGALNRFSPDDFRWLRSRGSDPTVRLGKFNPGQKLNTAFVGAALVTMLATGLVLRFFSPFPLAWRTGATFVHDWTALALGLAITGHVWLAVADQDALGGMVSGTVPAWWARQKRPRWYEEQEQKLSEEPAGTAVPGS